MLDVTELTELTALSPLDGRYRRKIEGLVPYFSEYALIAHRLSVMVECLIELSLCDGVPLRRFTPEEVIGLRKLKNPTLEEAAIIKAIETKGWVGTHEEYKKTNHDVKACELYLRDCLLSTSLADVVEWIHFGLTSEDVNNVAYALMLRHAITRVMVSAINNALGHVRGWAEQYAEGSMLGHTHEQPASPTTLGKEFNVYYNRVLRQYNKLRRYQISVKLNSATGNYNALVFTFPDVDWIRYSQGFVGRLNNTEGTNFRCNLVTTQIEPHDTYAELFNIMGRLNGIFIDFCKDISRYVSLEWIVQQPVAGEAGSSIMPHKVNPIDFENAEGNLGLANALFAHFASKLQQSRLQRDLSDSTVERNFGVAFGYSLVSYVAVAAGLRKMSPNIPKITADLMARPEVLTEAVQTYLRSIGYPRAYDALKDFARGKTITMESLAEFIEGLNIPQEGKEKLRQLSPDTYTGLAGKLALITADD